MTSDDPPTLWFYGDKDALMPISHSERIRDAFRYAKVVTQLILMESAGHGFRGEHGIKAATALADWFEHHLVRRSTD